MSRQTLLTPTLPILRSAHAIASQFCQRSHEDLLKAEQIYLNTLAVCIVCSYLEQLGFAPNRDTSDSWNPVWQVMTNVADIHVPGYGRIECRPLLPGEQFLTVPPEVWEHRVGYIAVQINRTQDEAILLGFIERVQAESVPLEQLRSLATLPAYLEQLKIKQLKSVEQQAAVEQETPVPRKTITSQTLTPLQMQEPIQLRQWLEGTFSSLWQPIERLLSPPQAALAWRNIAPSPELEQSEQESVERFKQLPIGVGESIALCAKITALSVDEWAIRLEIRPIGDRIYLPHELAVELLDESDQVLHRSQGLTEIIQYELSGKLGEGFSLQVSLEQYTHIEQFHL